MTDPVVPISRQSSGSDESLQQSEALRLAHECGAVSYTPGVLRAVRGVSLTFEQLDAFAARVLAQAAAPAVALTQTGGWQPIAEAAKNERESVIVTDGSCVGEAFWHDGSQFYGHRGKAGWFWEADRDSLLTASNVFPTHFQPLPLPPSPAAERAQERGR